MDSKNRAYQYDVSIIIPVRNGDKYLRKCLESIFQESQSLYEVIVIYDCSPDASASPALQFGCKVVSQNIQKGPFLCRNLGVEHASGDILLFFDADQQMSPDFIRHLIRDFRENPQISCVHGVFSWDTPCLSFFAQYKNFTHSFRHESLRDDSCLFSAGLCALRRSTFINIGGFEDDPLGDIRFGYRLSASGAKFIVDKKLLAYHMKEYTFSSLIISDIKYRAIPWTAVVLDGFRGKDSTTTWAALLPIILTHLSVVALVLWQWELSGLFLVAAILVRTKFHLYVLQRRDGNFALKVILFDFLMHFCQGVGCLIGVITYAKKLFHRRVTS